ncbi:MAG: thioredoxin domain-containing protein [Rhodomicrobiaceae bacterium]
MADDTADVPRGIVFLRTILALAILSALAGCAGGLPAALSEVSSTQTGAAPDATELRKPGPLEEKTLGNAHAPVTIIEYASLGCPICAAYHAQVFPQVKKAFIDTGKVYFIYREFPIGNTPAAAAQAARCVPDKQYFHINDKFLANRGRWNGRDPSPDLLYKIVQETGLSRTAFDSCMANQKTKDEIAEVKQRGRGLGVKGTPTFFINGQHVQGFTSYEEMRKLIEQHLQSAAKPV